VHAGIDQFFEPEPAGQGHRQHQPGVGHRVGVVETTSSIWAGSKALTLSKTLLLSEPVAMSSTPRAGAKETVPAIWPCIAAV
jgi:hypothetical protein